MDYFITLHTIITSAPPSKISGPDPNTHPKAFETGSCSNGTSFHPTHHKPLPAYLSSSGVDPIRFELRIRSRPGQDSPLSGRCPAAQKGGGCSRFLPLHTQTLLLACLLFSSRGGGFTKFRTDPRGKTVPTRRKTLAATGKYHPALHGAPGHRLALVRSGFVRDLAVPKRISTQSGWGGKKREKHQVDDDDDGSSSAIKTHVRHGSGDAHACVCVSECDFVLVCDGSTAAASV